MFVFGAETPAWSRWQALAGQKLPEIEAAIERAQRMKHLLQQFLTCDGLTLEECTTLLDAD